MRSCVCVILTRKFWLTRIFRWREATAQSEVTVGPFLKNSTRNGILLLYWKFLFDAVASNRPQRVSCAFVTMHQSLRPVAKAYFHVLLWELTELLIATTAKRLNKTLIHSFVCMKMLTAYLWYCAWRNWNSSLMRSQESEVVNLRGWLDWEDACRADQHIQFYKLTKTVQQ